MRLLSRTLAALVVLLAAGPASAQIDGRLTSPDSRPDGGFGVALASVGDVTGDGVVDLLVGAFQEGDADVPGGRAYVVDGATGLVRYGMTSPMPVYGGAFGVALTGMGDVDGDGVPDLAVGAPLDGEGGQVYLYAGASGELLRIVAGSAYDVGFGHALADAGDADGDGAGDLLVGDYKVAVDSPSVGVAHIVSGATGRILRTLFPPVVESGLDFGRAVASGDVTGDGVPDWIVAARRETVGSLVAGRVHVYSGADGSLVLSLASPSPMSGGMFGLSLAACADVDGDHVTDVIAGAGRESHEASQSGAAYVFRGTDGTLLRILQSPNPATGGWFGQNVTCVEDVDADGVADIAVGAAGESAGAPASGTVYVMSGATGEALAQLSSLRPEVSGRFGSWLAPMTKLPGTNRPLLAVGAYREDGPYAGAGAVYGMSVEPGTVAATPPAVPLEPRVGLVTPNPARTHISVVVTLEAPEAVEVSLVDVLGRVVMHHAMGPMGAGSHRLAFGTGGLATGRYTLRVQMAGRAVTRPFTVVR